MPAIIFPSSPTVGQMFVATNNVAYTWVGDRWSAENPVHNGDAVYTTFGGAASLDYYYADNTFDGGGAISS